MDEPEIRKKLNIIFRNIFDDDSIELTRDSSAKNIESWDSLTHVNIIVSIEMAFGIKFKTSEIESMQNVGHLLDTIRSKMA